MGNADLSAVLQADRSASVFTYFITKTSAWSAHDIFGTGQVSITVPSVGGGDFWMEQDLATATTTANVKAAANKSSATVESYITAGGAANALVTKVTVDVPAPSTITVGSSVYNGVTPLRTLENCTAYGRNGQKGRGGSMAGFASVAADGSGTMVGMRVECTAQPKATNRIGLATKVMMALDNDANDGNTLDTTKLVQLGGSTAAPAPTCGYDAMNRTAGCSLVVPIPAGATTLYIVTTSASNIAGRKSSLATKNLLEVTDGLHRPPLRRGGRRNPSVTSRCGSPLLSADVRSSDDAIAF